MRRCHSDAGLRLAALPHNHGLLGSDLPESAEEPSTVLGPLDVGANHAGVGILGEVLEQVRAIQQNGIPEADALVDAEPAALNARGHRTGVGAALGDDGHVANLLHVLTRPEAHTNVGIEDAHAVGAYHQNPGLGGHLVDLFLQLDALFLLGLAKTGSEEVDGVDALGDGVG